MRNILPAIMIMCGLLLASFMPASANDEVRDIHDTWMVVETWYPGGYTYHYPNEDGATALYVFDDSVGYVCGLRYVKDAIAIVPDMKFSYSIVYRGEGDLLYFEEGQKRPLRFVNDTTLMLQRHGARYTLRKTSGFVRENNRQILAIVRQHDYDHETPPVRYVISKAEVETRKANHTLSYIVAFLFLAFAAVAACACSIHRRDKRLRQRLKEIEEERRLLPEKLKEAQEEVAEDFFASGYYVTLRQRLASCERLSEDDWREMDEQLRRVYPDFARSLGGLVRMSAVEWRVCMLIKMRIAVRDIAIAMYKTPSSISTIRSRLYQKVFQKKGGAADWDKFILSL